MDKRKNRKTDAPGEMNTPRRPGQPGSGPDTRPQADASESQSPKVGPTPTAEAERGLPKFQKGADYQSADPAAIWPDSGTPSDDAKGQFAKTRAKPNEGGLVSANPTVLSGDGDATQGEGHGRDRQNRSKPDFRK
jgi:hypothetical protein